MTGELYTLTHSSIHIIINPLPSVDKAPDETMGHVVKGDDLFVALLTCNFIFKAWEL